MHLSEGKERSSQLSVSSKEDQRVRLPDYSLLKIDSTARIFVRVWWKDRVCDVTLDKKKKKSTRI